MDEKFNDMNKRAENLNERMDKKFNDMNKRAENLN
jgi:hypothetical protein